MIETAKSKPFPPLFAAFLPADCFVGCFAAGAAAVGAAGFFAALAVGAIPNLCSL